MLSWPFPHQPILSGLPVPCEARWCVREHVLRPVCTQSQPAWSSACWMHLMTAVCAGLLDHDMSAMQLWTQPVHVQVDPRNRQLMLQHITCAGAELPVLMEEDQAFFGPGLPAAARFLQTSGTHHPSSRRAVPSWTITKLTSAECSADPVRRAMACSTVVCLLPCRLEESAAGQHLLLP